MRLSTRGLLVTFARLMLLLPCAGCSATFQLASLGSEDETGETTASIRREAAKANDADLAYAKAAAAELLAQNRKGASLPWENPRTGARGTVTPLASTYAQDDGTLCHGFLASHVRAAQESWYEGEACRVGQRWEVRDIRPLQRT